jgi:ribosomal protein S21
MHSVTVRKEIVDRVLQRRGRYHLFDRLDPARTALVVIDMQHTFCAPGSPAEVPAARSIVEPINATRLENICRCLSAITNVEQALKGLKRKMQREGVFREMKRRKAHEKPSERKTRERAEAIRRVRKAAPPLLL